MYVLSATGIGVLWYLVLLLPPGTRDLLGLVSGRFELRERILTGIAFVVTGCLVSIVFRRPIARVRPKVLPLLATALMLLGAGLFTWIWWLTDVVVGDYGQLGGFAQQWSFGMATFFTSLWAFLFLGWITVPAAILSAFLLRFVSHASQARTPDSPAVTSRRDPFEQA